MTYAFTFDASACSGCKACQEACKDKNDLPVGVLWRRVIEVTGGGWQRQGDAWISSVFAYNLSLACSHCEYPKCAGVCPADAYTVRPDGIVLLDSSRCMGCGYCAWACPYSAPQYHPEKGVMTKCDLCADRLEVGEPPACVAACPLRSLSLARVEDFDGGAARPLWKEPAESHPFPLPDNTHVEPHLAIKLHRGMNSPLARKVSNREEFKPRLKGKIFGNPDLDELPLVLFTLLAQMAAGMAFWLPLVPGSPLAAWIEMGILLALAGAASFLHLGRKRNAWRALAHLRKSWLSRETLLTCLFGMAWAVAAFLRWREVESLTQVAVAILGAGLVYSMAQVYRLKTVPEWNSWRTLVNFALSALTLSAAGMYLVAPAAAWAGLTAALPLLPLGLALAGETFIPAGRARIIHLFCLALASVGTILLTIIPPIASVWTRLAVVLILLAALGLDRFHFYMKPRSSRL
jgi:anaerobic dimethyl sulfoxide reductase subunit B (iron-sulfur subunit)